MAKQTTAATRIDPVTGDTLPRLEYLTRRLQVVVRTPWFMLAFNVTTVLILLGHGDIWNYFASWLAIIVEWLVGTYMFGQTGRDAVVSRDTRATAQRTERMEREHGEMLSAILTAIRTQQQQQQQQLTPYQEASRKQP